MGHEDSLQDDLLKLLSKYGYSLGRVRLDITDHESNQWSNLDDGPTRILKLNVLAGKRYKVKKP